MVNRNVRNVWISMRVSQEVFDLEILFDLEIYLDLSI